ncbi:hypothetical protein F5X99DRAFT_395591 [Biscogniauxia marginata]|nr:hypothetical protein F5X99DRAFT_395591 [Biscogniauxia marginata]
MHIQPITTTNTSMLRQFAPFLLPILLFLLLLDGPLTALAATTEESPPEQQQQWLAEGGGWKIECRRAGPGCANVAGPANSGAVLSIRTSCQRYFSDGDWKHPKFHLREAIPCPAGEVCRIKIEATLGEGRWTECVRANGTVDVGQE